MTPPPIQPVQPRMAYWMGKQVKVRARSVPRYLWTTSSIDVYLDNDCILRTGGQLKLTGGYSTTFTDDKGPHQVDLRWGLSRWWRFPYELRIDGVLVEQSLVQVENWYAPLTGSTIIGAILGLWIALRIHHLLGSFGSGTQ